MDVTIISMLVNDNELAPDIHTIGYDQFVG